MGERARALARAQFNRAVLAAQWVKWLEDAAGAANADVVAARKEPS